MTSIHLQFPRTSRAFTMVEILVAVMVLALLGSGAIGGFLMVNRVVVRTRLATSAQAIAQSAIDRILAEPFTSSAPLPAALAPGSTTQNDVPIYIDPANGVVVVAGTVQTTITDISRPIVAGQPVPPLLHARVEVSYFAAGRPESFALETVRSAD